MNNREAARRLAIHDEGQLKNPGSIRVTLIRQNFHSIRDVPSHQIKRVYVRIIEIPHSREMMLQDRLKSRDT